MQVLPCVEGFCEETACDEGAWVEGVSVMGADVEGDIVAVESDIRLTTPNPVFL